VIGLVITTRQAEQLLRGNYSFSQLGFSMLLTRLKVLFSNDSSQEALERATAEINAFLNKFKGIMKNDCAKISDLVGGLNDADDI
jgi:hypothetical protein